MSLRYGWGRWLAAFMRCTQNSALVDRVDFATLLSMSSRSVTGLSALAPAQRAGVQRLCAMARFDRSLRSGVGVDRTHRGHRETDAIDPLQTWAGSVSLSGDCRKRAAAADHYSGFMPAAGHYAIHHGRRRLRDRPSRSAQARTRWLFRGAAPSDVIDPASSDWRRSHRP